MCALDDEDGLVIDSVCFITEVFFLPAAGYAEKDGCFTNTPPQARLVACHQEGSQLLDFK